MPPAEGEHRAAPGGVRRSDVGRLWAAEALDRAFQASWVEFGCNSRTAVAASAQLCRTRCAVRMGPLMPVRGGRFEAGGRLREFWSDVPVEWLVPVHVLLHAARDNVRAGRSDSETALHVLTTTMSAAFAPPSRFAAAAAASDFGTAAIRRFGT